MSNNDIQWLEEVSEASKKQFTLNFEDNPLDWISMEREEFADLVLQIMSNPDLKHEEKSKAIDVLIAKVQRESEARLLEWRLEHGYDPVAEERDWYEDQKLRGRAGL